jgi:prepilin-type N-terminal cleavage/methylation domain-containing protein
MPFLFSLILTLIIVLEKSMNHRLQGFTLSELLVSLAVLGLIAAFAIPKVLTAVGESSSRAIGRELLGMISESYQAIRANNNGNVPRATTAQDLINTMNYARVGTGGNGQGAGTNGTTASIVLQNAAQVAYIPADSFASVTAGTNGVIGFTLDPDGSDTSGALDTNANGPITVYLGGDGRIWAGHTGYQAGTGGVASPFNANALYSSATETGVTLIAPSVAGNSNSSTTWFS